jgi:tetratricopeptide (TPR) repeat protein
MHPAIRRAEIEAAGRKPPSNLRSYDLAIRAYPKLSGQIAAAINEAIATLNEATRIDQSYGRAYALLAWCHALKVTYIWSSERERDLEAACRAVEATRGLIEDDPTALTAAGAATGHCGDQGGASALIEQAIALDPNNAWAWTRWGWIGIYRGQPDRASERFEMAMRLSPLDPFVFNTRMEIAAARALPGRLDEAIAIARVVTNKHPDATWPFRQLAAWSAMKGDMETARWAAQRTLAAHPEFTIERYLGIPTFRNVPAFRDGMAAGLRAAGLPER